MVWASYLPLRTSNFFLPYFCSVLEEFKHHIENKFSALRQKTFLLACSGGVDSVVLAHLCAKCNMDFALAHCNFKLRGEASDTDERFVLDLSKSLNKHFFVTHFDTKDYIIQNKVSVQMAARELRYRWFAELMEKNGFTTLVTAHQADDNLETFLINLSRGTGIDGLIGIPERTDTIVRPLLKFSRARILEYASTEGIAWREDSSNEETKYLRNKIRHEIVPKLKELHPTFLGNFLKTQDYLHQTAEIAENAIGKLKKQLFQKEGEMFKIAVSPLLDLSPLWGYMYALFNAYGFTEWSDVLGLLTAASGKEVRSNTHRLVKDRGHLLLEKIGFDDSGIYRIHANEVSLLYPIKLSIARVDGIEETSERILYVDKETLRYPLTVRKWRKGDYFYPFGMKGKKKVSKFFKDEKVDVISKAKQWLLCSGDDIVWITGKRSDNRFKVTEKTRNILKFTLEE